ncbi:MAG: sodium:solute symporter [Bacteroidetes bacterium]|nr:MAG: sodium:solute symporter [Bacteroidota bacterium]
MLWIFIPMYLGLTLAIGLWASRRVRNVSDFTLAGRRLSTGFVGVTIFATWFGASQVMGNPGDFVQGGGSVLVTHVLGPVLCLLIVGFFYARRLYRMQIITVGDFFLQRYNKRLEVASSVLLVCTYFQWIAAQFVALAYLFQAVWGLSTPAGVLLGASIVVLYTYIGGMWAVSLTDMLQSVVILLGLVWLLGNVLVEAGGLGSVLAGQPEGFFRLVPETVEGWGTFVALLFAFVLGTIPVQEVYQRIFSAWDERAAFRGSLWAAGLLLVLPAIPMVIGLVALYLHPDLATVAGGQRLLPEMVMRYGSDPLQVVFFGALISAILSTSSGALLSPATLIGENLLGPYLGQVSDSRRLLWTRLSVLVVAAIAVFFALRDAHIVGLVVDSVSLALVCLFAPFTLGLFWAKASTFGAWMAILLGGGVWIGTLIAGTSIDPIIYGTIVSCVAMVLGSWAKPDSPLRSG